MATDGEWVQGQVTHAGDEADREERDVEKMLVGFLRALLDETRETNN
jgi:hypothetical protein